MTFNSSSSQLKVLLTTEVQQPICTRACVPRFLKRVCCPNNSIKRFELVFEFNIHRRRNFIYFMFVVSVRIIHTYVLPHRVHVENEDSTKQNTRQVIIPLLLKKNRYCVLFYIYNFTLSFNLLPSYDNRSYLHAIRI